MKRILAFFFLMTFVVLSATAQTVGRKHKKKKHIAPVESNQDMLSDLQGKWASLDDKKSFFIISDHDQQNFYADKMVDTTFINFYNKCPQHVSVKDGLRITGKYLVTRDKDYTIYCYRILKINTKILELMYLPKGNILRYRKQYFH